MEAGQCNCCVASGNKQVIVIVIVIVSYKYWKHLIFLFILAVSHSYFCRFCRQQNSVFLQ